MTKQQLKMSSMFELPVSICKKTYNNVVESDGAIIANCPTKAITERVIFAINNHDSQQELINELTEKLEKAMVAFRNQVELKIVHPNHRKETEDLADELFKTITKAKGDK